MKRFIYLTLSLAVMFILFACGDSNEKSFVGTWGIEKLEYWKYNVDYAGNPITASYFLDTVYEYDVNDPSYGIQLVFNKDKTGEYRDFAIDSIWFKWNETLGRYDTYLAPPATGYDSVIYCPDTTLVYSFRYVYDEDDHDLVMKMSNLHTFMMTIVEFTDNSIISENRFDLDEETHTEKMEKFYMKRVGNASKQGAKSGIHHPVSRLTMELFNQEH